VGTDTAGLAARVNIKMVQMKAIVCGTKGVEANPLTVGDDKLGVLRIERLPKTLASPLRIEAPDLLQTGPHRGDAEGGKLFEVVCSNVGECHAGGSH